MTNTPFFSIIMPTFNRVFCIQKAIDSVLCQSYPHFELIIVDDGSSDATRSFVFKNYTNELAEKKIIFKRFEENQGVCKARNEGIRLAKYPWIAYMDTDNQISDDFFETFALTIQKYPRRKTFYAQMKKASQTEPFGRAFKYADLFERNYIDMGVFVHERSVFEKLGGFDETLKRLVDWDLVLTYTYQFKPVFIEKVLLSYEDSDAFSRISNQENWSLSRAIIFRKHIKQFVLSHFLWPLAKIRIENEKIIYLFGIPIFSRRIEDNKKRYRFLGIRFSKPFCTFSFKKFADLSKLIRQKISILHASIDLIVGVPRSGMIPAYMIALFLNKKVCSLDEFINKITPSCGERSVKSITDYKHVLIVDDSICSGFALSKTKERLGLLDLNSVKIEFLAVYCLETNKDMVDYFFEVTPLPRLFQWNYLNHCVLKTACLDIDGVLCVDPTRQENDDGDKYKEFILTAKPLFVPSYKVYSLVTSRLEKYRPETQAWLLKHGIEYDHLYMLNLNSKEERQRLNAHASFKAEIYSLLTKSTLFIESEPAQAKEIARLSKKPCICVQTDEYFV